MDERFNLLASDPWAQVFQVVFFPDRIYHAQYLNATRSSRYRYNVREVRGKADINVMKGEVFLDGLKFSNFLRIEYRGSRLVETVREKSRFLSQNVQAEIRVSLKVAPFHAATARVAMDYCPWIDGWNVELWETLEPPVGTRHDYQVLSMMGYRGCITVVPQFAPALAQIDDLRWVNLSFKEAEQQPTIGRTTPEADLAVDNYYERNIQRPQNPTPSSYENTDKQHTYGVDFQRGWYFEDVRKDIEPVRYRNAMMNEDSKQRNDNDILEMRWILQQEFGGSVVFFHEVLIPPGVVEGTHRHIGSEELHYVVEGTGLAYLGSDDDPKLANIPLVERDIYGFGPRQVRLVPVKPGSVIFTKSGGIHGIENNGTTDLRFVAFLYHSA